MVPAALAARSCPPAIEATPRDTERLAHPVHGPDPPVLRDEGELHGPRSSYTIVRSANGNVTITDNRPSSPDGTDTLIGVEYLGFANGVLWDLRTAHDFSGDGTSDI